MKKRIVLIIAIFTAAALCAFTAVCCDVNEKEQTEPTYKLSFDSAGGNETFGDMSYREGEVLSSIAVPTRSGYVFSCWKDADGNIYNSASVMPAHDVALTAEWTQSNVTYSVADDGVEITGCNDGGEELIIPEMIQGFPVTAIAASAFNGNLTLKSVTLPDSMVYIGINAFQFCSNLENIDFGNGLQIIVDYAFQDCKSLKELNLPASLNRIGMHAFMNCNVEKVNITDLDAWCGIDFYSSYESNPASVAGGLYLNGEPLKNVVIPEGVTSVKDFAFAYTDIESLVLPDSVTEIGSCAFMNCASLGSVSLPPVKEVGATAFSGCSSLASVTLSEGTEKINSEAFANCSSLKKIDLPASVTDIESSAFAGCTSLAEVTLREGLKRIQNRAFRNCASLTEATIPDSVTELGEAAFEDCTTLERVYIGKNVSKIDGFAFNNCSSLSAMTFAETEGWSYAVSEYEPASNRKEMDAATLANASDAARVFTSTHKEYYWERG